MRVRFAPSPTGALHIGGARTALYNWLLARGHGRHARAAHRGHRPRALDAGERRADPRRAALARARLGRGPDLPGRSAPTATARSLAAAARRRATPTARTADADDVKAYKERARRRPRLPRRAPRARGRRAPARARRGRDRRPRRDPRRDRVRSTCTSTTRDRPRRRQRRSTTSRSPSTTSTPASPTSSAARTTSPTRPSSCSSSRRSAREPPVYAHLPLLHGPDGKKLSKRHGAASVQELRDAGYLPEAVRNYLALLGWGDDETTTILHHRRAGRALLARARLAATRRVFDEQKLRWMNGRYLRELAADELTRAPGGVHRPRRACATPSRSRRRRSRRSADFWPLAGFLFDGPADDPKAREQVARPTAAASALAEARAALATARAVRRRARRGGAARRRASARDAKPKRRLPAGARRDRRDHGLTRDLRDASRCSGATRRCARIDAALRR